MLFVPPPTCGSPVSSPDSFRALRLFLQDNRDGFANAAKILAGRRGMRVLHTVLDGVRTSDAPTRAVRAAMRDLLGILTLEHVHDENREEAALFAAIDPAAPVVEEICLLSDGLRRCLEEAFCNQIETVASLQSAA